MKRHRRFNSGSARLPSPSSECEEFRPVSCQKRLSSQNLVALYNNLFCLMQDLELILTYCQSLPTTISTKAEFQELCKQVISLDSRFRSTLGTNPSENLIRDLVVVLKDLVTLFCTEQFKKYRYKLHLLNSEPPDFKGQNLSIFWITESVDLWIHPMDCINKFKRLYDAVNLITNFIGEGCFTGEGYFEIPMSDMAISLKKDIGKDMELLNLMDDFLKFYEKSMLLDLVVTDNWEESYADHNWDLINSYSKIEENIKINNIGDLVFSMLQNLDDRWPYLGRDIQGLYDNVSLMVSLLRNSNIEIYSREVMINFQHRIRDVVHKVPEHMKILVKLGERNARPYWFPLPKPMELPNLIEEIACFNEKLKKIHEDREMVGKTAPPNAEDPESTAGNSTLLNRPRKYWRKDGKLVGLEKELEKMLECLVGKSSSKVFFITGMAGIGKTTLAKELYDHPLVMHHFDARAWVTVSQEYESRGMLLGLLSCLTNLSNEIFESGTEVLKEQLYRSLKGKRYLIVLDDVWDKRVWDDLRRAFPNDMNDNRVLMTSRLQDVAIHASPEVLPHCLRCLSLEESWELLRSKSFKNESCPPELLQIGKHIASRCRGLPLAIVVVGGLLSKMDKTLKVWEEVAQNVGTLVMDGPHPCQNIFALSYNNLPNSLKVCCLYMGIFPEDYEISSKKLIHLWITEGFVQLKKQKSLEEMAENYLEELIDRCIILVKRKRSNGRIKTCHIHDMMREFCLRESQKENFLDVLCNLQETAVKNVDDIQKYHQKFDEKGIFNRPRLAIYSNLRMFTNVRSALPSTRSFFCFETLRPTDVKCCSGICFSMLLKVLDLIHIHFFSLPSGISLLINLKYLALNIRNSFPLLELFNLRKLQFCIIDGEFGGDFPMEFWHMIELRDFYVRRRIFDHPCAFSAFKTFEPTILQNLHSLSTIGPSNCTKEKFLSMPNLKKLGVYETEEDDEFVGWHKNLVCLTQLETLKYAFSNPFTNSKVRPKHCPCWEVLTPNLMKLTLSGTSFRWEDMQQLSLLPKLEVLKLKNYAFSGPVWNMGESCFNGLKFLMIGSTNLAVWEADESNFPSLEHLVLRHCRSLEKIPQRIGEAPLLERIELHRCSDSAADSARQLEEEQQGLGNDWLKVCITER